PDEFPTCEVTHMTDTTTAPQRTLPKIVSVDDHVVEPPDLWERWLPAAYRDRAPRVVQAPYAMGGPAAAPRAVPASDGPLADWWAFEDLRVAVQTVVACAGLDRDELTNEPIMYREMRP